MMDDASNKSFVSILDLDSSNEKQTTNTDQNLNSLLKPKEENDLKKESNEVGSHDTSPKSPSASLSKDGNESGRKSEWTKNLVGRASEIQKSLTVAADITKNKIQSSLAVATDIATERLHKSINLAADKFGLLTGKHYLDFAQEDGVNEATIPAGTSTKIPFFVPKNKAIAWKVMVKNFDLGFLVRLREQCDGGSLEQELEPLWKIGSDELFVGGRRAVPFDRYIVLVFDNSYSRLRSKTYCYQVLNGEPAAEALSQAQNTAELHALEREREAIERDGKASSDAKDRSSESEHVYAREQGLSESPVSPVSSVASVRYLSEGVSGVVSSIVIKAQSASSAISTRAKTVSDNVKTMDWWGAPYIKRFVGEKSKDEQGTASKVHEGNDDKEGGENIANSGEGEKKVEKEVEKEEEFGVLPVAEAPLEKALSESEASKIIVSESQVQIQTEGETREKEKEKEVSTTDDLLDFGP